MKIRLALIAVVFASLIMAIPAGATSYQAFGNNVVGDCLYAAEANLVKFHEPNAIITTQEVVQAWAVNGQDGAFTYLETTGFGGYTVSAETPLGTPSNHLSGLESAVRNGGVLAIMHLTPASYGGKAPANHAYAVIGATTNYVKVVSWGRVLWIPRTLFSHELTFMFAVTWAGLAVR
jgi:hypothetical protein